MGRIILGVLALALGVYIGNRAGDQATLRDCATIGQAIMLGGGTINCQAMRQAPSGKGGSS